MNVSPAFFYFQPLTRRQQRDVTLLLRWPRVHFGEQRFFNFIFSRLCITDLIDRTYYFYLFFLPSLFLSLSFLSRVSNIIPSARLHAWYTRVWVYLYVREHVAMRAETTMPTIRKLRGLSTSLYRARTRVHIHNKLINALSTLTFARSWSIGRIIVSLKRVLEARIL